MNNSATPLYSVVTYYDKKDKTKIVHSDFNEYKDASEYFYVCLTEEVRFCGCCHKQERIVVLLNNESTKTIKKVKITSFKEQI